MNYTLHNVDVSSVIGLLNRNNLPQAKKSIKVNEMNMSVENGDVNVGYCYINSSTGYFIRNHHSIDYKNKRDEISANRYLRENNGLPDGVDIDDVLSASSLNQYFNME